MSLYYPRSQRGALTLPRQIYGYSALGAPLLWFPAPQASAASGLVLAGTHGDETAAVILLSAALRTLRDEERRHHVVLTVNPDGCQLGLRANAHGVDLNRNFPAASWLPGETVYRWNSLAQERDVRLSTGSGPSSEPETQALCALIHQLHPRWVVSLHEPLACIEDPHSSQLGQWLAEETQLTLVTSVGYDTPGSFGSWCGDLQLSCITAELPAISAEEATERYLSAIIQLLCWRARS